MIHMNNFLDTANNMVGAKNMIQHSMNITCCKVAQDSTSFSN